MPRRAPSTERAEAFLRAALGAPGTKTERLPNVYQLATNAGVSMVTMLKAVHLLRDQGLLDVSHGRGIRKRNPQQTTIPAQALVTPASTSTRRWMQVRSAIASDITNGRYAAGDVLPAAKELAERHGVCRATLARALRELAADHRLRAYRRRLVVPQVRRPETANTILLFARGDDNGNLQVLAPRLEEHLRALERECAKAQVRLVLQTVAPDGTFFTRAAANARALVASPESGMIIGTLIWAMGINAAGLTRILDFVAQLHRPVALFCEYGPEELPAEPLRRSRASVFCLAPDQPAGEQVGRYLLGLGHRTVAFISPVHGAAWSRKRFDGLRTALGVSGVHAFTLAKTGQHEFVTDAGLGSADAVQRQVRAVISGGHPTLAYIPHVTTRTLSVALEHDAMGVALEPLLDQAMAEPSITAWVTASDSVAILCLDYLHRHSVGVPDRLSVVGFDDALDAFLYRLTSYNFNGSAAIHAMFASVVDHHSPKSTQQTPRHVAFDGFVAERSTSGRPRRAG